MVYSYLVCSLLSVESPLLPGLSDELEGPDGVMADLVFGGWGCGGPLSSATRLLCLEVSRGEAQQGSQPVLHLRARKHTQSGQHSLVGGFSPKTYCLGIKKLEVFLID